jgi:hypothetical protein
MLKVSRQVFIRDNGPLPLISSGLMSEGQTHCNSCDQPLGDADLNSKGFGPAGLLLCADCRRLSRAQRRDGWQPLMQWEDGREVLRLASRAPVPWDSPNVAMLQLTRGGGLRAVHTLTGKRQMLQEAAPSDMVLVAWPGSRRQDVFIVDDRKSALRALGQ